MPPIPPFMGTWKTRPFDTEGLWFRTTNLPPFHPVPELSLITTIKVLKDPRIGICWVKMKGSWTKTSYHVFHKIWLFTWGDYRGRVVVFCVVQVPICLFLHMIIRSCFKKFLVSPSSPHARCHRHWGNGGCQVTKTSILVFKRSSPIYEKQISTEKCIQNKTYSANWWPLRNGETWPF